MTNEASTIEETAAVAEQGANVAPEKASSKKDATSKQDAPKAKKSAKAAKPEKPAGKKTAKAAAPMASKKASKRAKKAAKPVASKKVSKANAKTEARPDSKKAIVLDLLRRKHGATMAEIVKATDWAEKSIRGFVSGQCRTKLGLKIESAKNEQGERTYRIFA